MMLLQAVAAAAAQVHPLSGTIAEWVWLLPVLPLAGFVINGLLSLNSAHFGPADPTGSDHASREEGEEDHRVERHRWAGVTSIIGPGVLIIAFGLAVAMWQAMVSAHPEAPFIQRYFSWIP